MLISYKPNPLATTVELSPTETRELWHRVKASELQDRLFTVHFCLEQGNVERATQEADPSYYFVDGRSPLDRRVDDLRDWYVTALMEPHEGDCTCVPCSCPKCIAEDVLGLDTLKGLDKYSGASIQGAFRDGPTLHEAIQRLSAWVAPAKSERWVASEEEYAEQCEKWRLRRVRTRDWLVAYQARTGGVMTERITLQ